jgi:hypothetical protein
MMTTATLATETMTWDEHVAYMHQSGFKWQRSDAVVITQDAALLAVDALDERIQAHMPYGDTLTDAIQARDEIQSAICRAVEAS